MDAAQKKNIQTEERNRFMSFFYAYLLKEGQIKLFLSHIAIPLWVAIKD
jgi:hypothetical protein